MKLNADARAEALVKVSPPAAPAPMRSISSRCGLEIFRSIKTETCSKSSFRRSCSCACGPGSMARHSARCSTFWSAADDPDAGSDLRLHRASGHAQVLRCARADRSRAPPARSRQRRALRLASKHGNRIKVLWFDHNSQCTSTSVCIARSSSCPSDRCETSARDDRRAHAGDHSSRRRKRISVILSR